MTIFAHGPWYTEWHHLLGGLAALGTAGLLVWLRIKIWLMTKGKE